VQDRVGEGKGAATPLALVALVALGVASCAGEDVAGTLDAAEEATVEVTSTIELASDSTVVLAEGALTGTWARAEWLEARAVFPALGETLTHTLTIQRVLLTHEGAVAEMQGEVCAVLMDNASGLVEIVPSPAFVDAIVFQPRAAALEQDADGTIAWREPRVWDVRGADLEEPASDPLPTSPEDVTVIDLDQDGHPGVTVRVSGILDGEIYVTQRQWTELEGRIDSPDRVAGALAWGDEQTVLGADNAILQGFEAASEPVDGRFVLVRVEGLGCDAIVAARDDLFGAF